MKLDNRGWGLREMLIYSSVLLICLLLATFLISMLYSDLEESVSDSKSSNSTFVKNNSANNGSNNKNDNEVFDLNYYYNYEDRLIDAARVYLGRYPNIVDEESMKISLDTLEKEKLINKLSDIKTKNICSAYVVVETLNEEYDVKSYVACDSYKTKGY